MVTTCSVVQSVMHFRCHEFISFFIEHISKIHKLISLDLIPKDE